MPSVFGTHGDILELGRVGEGDVGVAEWFFVLPCDQVEPVALIQPGQAEHGVNEVDLTVGQRPNSKLRRSIHSVRK